MYCGIVSSQAEYSSVYSSGDGVKSLITEPSDRSELRIGRLVSFRRPPRKRPEYERLISSSTKSKSFLKSETNTGPSMIASVIALEISDFPPPLTVHGLWQNVPSATVPMSRHARPPGGLCIRTL